MSLILTDRSRYVASKQHCERARFLEYDYMGTGIRLKKKSLAPTTGIALHEPLADLLRHVMDGKLDGDDPLPLLRAIIRHRTTKYVGSVGEMVGFEKNEQLQWAIAEQAHLVEALYWCFVKTRLQPLLDEFAIVAVEEEMPIVAGCSCGLSDLVGGIEDHRGRGCGAVVVMTRGDFVGRRKQGGALEAFDFKTSAGEISSDAGEYELQMALITTAVARHFGEACSHYNIIGLHKGRREFMTKAEREGGGMKKQNTPLCYPWMVEGAGWKTRYLFSTGGQRPPRVPAWEALVEAGHEADATPAEYQVIELMTREEAGAHVSHTGPIQVDEQQAGRIVRQVYAYESDQALRREAYVEAGGGENLEESEETLDALFGPSWDCVAFAEKCPFWRVCRHEGVWQAPLKSGDYEPREPHHAAEKEKQNV